MRLLTTEWLIADIEGDQRGKAFTFCFCYYNFLHRATLLSLTAAAVKRSEDLVRIRQIFIPELIIKLHFMLFSSRKVIPEYVPFPLLVVYSVIDGFLTLYLPILGHSLHHQEPQTRSRPGSRNAEVWR